MLASALSAPRFCSTTVICGSMTVSWMIRGERFWARVLCFKPRCAGVMSFSATVGAVKKVSDMLYRRK